MKKIIKKIKLIIFFIFVLSILNISNFNTLKADPLQDQLSQIQTQINSIKTEKDQIQSQINSNTYTLQGYNAQISQTYGQLQIYNKQIDQIKLQIKQFQIKIQQLNDSIDQQNKDIARLEAFVVMLEKQSIDRISNSFVNFKIYGGSEDFKTVLNFTKINDYFINAQYKELIQSDTNKTLLSLATVRKELQNKKETLAKDLINISKDQDSVNAQQIDLQKQSEQLNLKASNLQGVLATIQNLNDNNKTLINNLNQTQSNKQSQYNEIQQEIINNSGSYINNGYVKAGSRIGTQGHTGWAYGDHLHFVVKENNNLQNPCKYLTGGFVIPYGYGDCAGNGKLQWPLGGSVYYVNSWYGQCAFVCPHLAIDIQSPQYGAPVYAAQNGYITKLVDRASGANVVIICEVDKCKSGIETQYWHLSSFAF